MTNTAIIKGLAGRIEREAPVVPEWWVTTENVERLADQFGWALDLDEIGELVHFCNAMISAAPQPQLWAIHIPGMDDYYPAPSEHVANHMAEKHNAAMAEWYKANPDTSGNRPAIDSSLASAKRWPGSAADHEEEIAVFDYAAWGLEALQQAPQAAQRAAAPVKLPIPPAQADMLSVVFADGWNQCCDTFFGGLPAQEPVVITIEHHAAPQATPIARPLSDEQDSALCEAHFNAASDEYFAARKALDFPEMRRIFYAGFRKAWIVERAHGIKGD